MNEDQVKGSIHALKWIQKQIPLSNNSRVKIEREIAGLEFRLKAFQGPTPQETAARAIREQKRLALESRVEAQKTRIDLGVTYGPRQPDYTSEPSDFRPLPHFRGRE